MNDDFKSTYLALLSRQVDEEIQFLVQNGHDQEKIYNPCVFCLDTFQGYYRCFRLSELKGFASNITVTKATKKENNEECPIVHVEFESIRNETERKPIGREPIGNKDLEWLENEDMSPIIMIK